MSNADIKTLLIVFIFMPFLPLAVECLGKSKVRAFTRRMLRQIWTELAELGNTASNNRRQKLAHTRLHALGGKTPERKTKGQKAEWFAVVDFVLLTISQNGTKLTRSAFSRHLPVYRIEGQKEDENGPFAKARQR
jgi:hypothetical protein